MELAAVFQILGHYELQMTKVHGCTGTGTTGVVSLQEVYSLPEARRRLGWTQSAMRAACRLGLKPLTSGERKYVTSSEILRFLEHDSASKAAIG